MTSVLLVDDHAVVREGLRTFLDLQDGIDVIGEAADGNEAVREALRLDPDVILMDLVMPELDGVGAMRRLRAEAPRCRVIVLTSFLDEERLLPAIQAGAAGYLLKNAQPTELARAIHAAQRGETIIDPTAAARLVEAIADNATRVIAEPERLTRREREVLELIAARTIEQADRVRARHLREDGEDARRPSPGQARRHRSHPGGAPRRPRRVDQRVVLGPIAAGERDRDTRTVVACHSHSSPEPPAGSASPSPARSPTAAGRSSSTPVTSAISTPSPVSSASAPRSRRSPATSPTRIIAARCSHAAGDTIDLLANNASILGPSPQPPLADYPLATLQRVYEVNVFAPLALTQLALPRMPDGAAIINVTSDAAVEPYEGWGGYGSSKAALEQLTRDPRRRASGAPRPRRRPRRHADADAPGRVPRRGHLGSPASGGERAGSTHAHRGRACRAGATGRGRSRFPHEHARVRAAGGPRGRRPAGGMGYAPRRGPADGRRA